MELEQGCTKVEDEPAEVTASDKRHNTELTVENVRSFNNVMENFRRSSDSEIRPRDASPETKINKATSEERPKKLLNDSVQIIKANDRIIPLRVQDEVKEVLGISCLDATSGRSKGVQTRISGVRRLSNYLYPSDLAHPATIMNAAIRSSSDTSPCISYTSELSLTRSHLYNVHCNYQRLKLRFHKLHEDYYKLIRVAGELTVALENSVHGNAVDLSSTLKSCINIYPDLFNQNVRDDSAEIKSIKSEIEIRHHDLTESRQPILSIVPVSPKLFDYKKIKLHLMNGNVKTKLLLLQALRWKLTLSQPAERDEAIHEYTSSDLLGLHGQIASDSGKSILPYLLTPSDVVLPHPLQQSAARLLNALASLRCGRDYLSVGPAVLNVVVQSLDTAKAETVDAFTCDMILAMLQKMSLRRQQRLYMIGMGLVEWLIYHLKSESHKIGTYRLEYTTALLMNLSLHREAQVRASTMTTLVLSTLTELLSSSHTPALPYVNGALNNFLANHTINEEAKKMGLESVLEHHRRRNSGEIRKHLDHILKRHRRSSSEAIDNITAADDDDSEELDVLENELDEMDPVKVHSGELFGEALLATCYSTSSNMFPRSSHDDSQITSAQSSKLNNPKLTKHRNTEIYDSSFHERLLSPRRSPSFNTSRFTPQDRKLSKKNTTQLNPINCHQNFVQDNNKKPAMISKSVEAQYTSDTSSGSEDSSSDEESQYTRSINAIPIQLFANDISKNSSYTGVNSLTTLVSAYESAAEVEDRMSSIASLNPENGPQNEILPETEEKNLEPDADEEAFLSKPKILRTPPQSAIIRVFTPSDEDKIVADILS